MFEWCFVPGELTWSREFAVTSLVARSGVSPFGKLLTVKPSRARGLLCRCLSLTLGGRHDATYPEEAAPASIS
jgi:hypothetical protein